MRRLLFILLFLAVSLPFSLSAQNRQYPVTSIEGTVTDSITGEALPYANIFLKGSTSRSA